MRFKMGSVCALLPPSAVAMGAAAAVFGAVDRSGRAEVRATAGGGADFLMPVNDVYHAALAGFEVLTISK